MLLSYSKLFRPVNLLIIAATQYLVLFYVIRPFMLMSNVELQMSHLDFALFVFSNLLLAAAGYAINDYYDTDIDAVNKPDKNVLLTKIPRKKAYTLNFVLNALACAIGFYIAFRVGSFKLGFLFVVVALVLFYYSLKYKRQFLTGNIVVALLAAYSVLSVWLFQFFAIKNNPVAFADLVGSFSVISIFVGGLALFAFLTTLIREIIKDMEDREGDKEYGCNTLPVNKGFSFTKKIVLWLTIFTMMLLAGAQFFLFSSFYMVTWYFFVVQIMFVYLIIKVMKSKEKEEFHFLSIFAKIIMIAGILATQIFYIHF